MNEELMKEFLIFNDLKVKLVALLRSVVFFTDSLSGDSKAMCLSRTPIK